MDLYRIAIALSMTSNHAMVLGALSRHLFYVHGQVNQLHGAFGRLGLAVGGALSTVAGLAMLDVMGKLVEKTKDYSHELVKLERLGGEMGAAVRTGEVEKLAFDITKRVGMAPTDIMKLLGVSYSIFGKKETMAMAEDQARLAYVLASQRDFKGDTGEDMTKLLRAAEITGRLGEPGKLPDVAITKKFLDFAAKTIAATHGVVSPQTLLNMAQTGGGFMRGLDEKGFGTMAILAQAMGGFRAGTSFISLFNQLGGGQMTKRTAAGMEEMGLLRPGDYTGVKGSSGLLKLSDEASKRLTGLLGKDPMEFFYNIVDKFREKGITDPMDQARMVSRFIGRQTGQRFTAEGIMNILQMIQERGRLEGGLGVDASMGILQNKDVEANMQNVGKAWERLQQAVAGPLTDTIVSVLNQMREVLISIGDWARANPAVVRELAIGFTALGAALTVLGGAAIIGALVSLAGPGGLIAALAVGVLALENLRWKDINSGVSEFAREIQFLAQAVGITKKPFLYEGAGGMFTPGATPPKTNLEGVVTWLKDWAPALDRVSNALNLANQVTEAMGRGFQGLAIDLWNQLPSIDRIKQWGHDAYLSVTTGFESFYAKMRERILGLPSELAEAITSAFASIRNMIANAIGGSSDRRAIIGPERGFAGPGGPPGGFLLNPPPRSTIPPNFDWFDFGTGGASYHPPGGSMPSGAQNAIMATRGNTTISVPIKLDIDGRTLADVISQRLADIFELPTQAPGFNSQGGYSPGAWPQPI